MVWYTGQNGKLSNDVASECDEFLAIQVLKYLGCSSIARGKDRKTMNCSILKHAQCSTVNNMTPHASESSKLLHAKVKSQDLKRVGLRRKQQQPPAPRR
eukprot:4827174-Amphidinium_carterae.1